MPITGYTNKTKENLVLGAGALYKDYDPTEDTYKTASAKLLGATQGGSKFEAKPTIRAIQVDGIAGDAKGLQVIDKWDVMLTVNMLETSANTLKLALGASSTDSTSDDEYDIITAKSAIADSDYLGNITWIGTKSGSDVPLMIQIHNALCNSGLALEFKDMSDNVVAVTFKGHYGEDGEVPFTIYSPKEVVEE